MKADIKDPAVRRLLETIHDLVYQHCGDTSAGENTMDVFSGFISANADAIELLIEYDLAKPKYKRRGRDISATLEDFHSVMTRELAKAIR